MRSHVSVRSYYFRELVASVGYPEKLSLEDFRIFWIRANRKANEWRRQAGNCYSPITGRWSDENPNYRSAMIDAGRGHLLR